jgi:hypothetical protein
MTIHLRDLPPDDLYDGRSVGEVCELAGICPCVVAEFSEQLPEELLDGFILGVLTVTQKNPLARLDANRLNILSVLMREMKRLIVLDDQESQIIFDGLLAQIQIATERATDS